MEDTLYNQIERYLNGKMDDESKRDFESMLSSNIELSKDVDIYASIKLFFEENSWDFKNSSDVNKDLLKKLESYFASKENKELEEVIKRSQEKYYNKTGYNKNHFLLYAAVFFGIFLVINYFFIQTKTSNTKLYATYINYKDLPSISVRSGNSTLKLAKEYFNKAEYSKAVDEFSNYVNTTNQINPFVYIYLAISLSEIGEYKEALSTIDSFEQLNNLDINKANWYRALIYLKKNDLVKSKEYLKMLITDKDNYKYKEAKELLKDLE